MPCHCGGRGVSVVFLNLFFLPVPSEGCPYFQAFRVYLRRASLRIKPTHSFVPGEGEGEIKGMRGSVMRTRVRHPRVRNNNN